MTRADAAESDSDSSDGWLGLHCDDSASVVFCGIESKIDVTTVPENRDSESGSDEDDTQLLVCRHIGSHASGMSSTARGNVSTNVKLSRLSGLCLTEELGMSGI